VFNLTVVYVVLYLAFLQNTFFMLYIREP